MWYIYMVRCSDATLYTGITTDPIRRLNEHNRLKKAAKYTRIKRPVQQVYLETAATRSAALIREHAIKKLTRPKKELLIQGQKE